MRLCVHVVVCMRVCVCDWQCMWLFVYAAERVCGGLCMCVYVIVCVGGC